MIIVSWARLLIFVVSFYRKAEVTSMKLISTFIKKLSADLRRAYFKCVVAEWELVSSDSLEKFLYMLGHIVKGIFNCSRKYMFIMGKKIKISLIFDLIKAHELTGYW